MDFSTGFFYLFSAVLVFSAFRVVTARNPVHAVLFLMLAFSQASGIWLLLRAEFLAIALVLVYLGAVMVLFLFVVMMLDIRIEGARQGFWRQFPIAAGIGVLVALQMAAVLMNGFATNDHPTTAVATVAAHQVQQYSNARALGHLFYTEYLYPFEIAAVILLVAMIAAIALTLRIRKDSKKVDASLQVRARSHDRVELVSVPVVRPAREDARHAALQSAQEGKS